MSNEPTMTPEDVQAWVEKIRRVAGDDEVAHSEEDKLYQAILQAIAEERIDRPRDCAHLALQTQEIDFARWCA